VLLEALSSNLRTSLNVDNLVLIMKSIEQAVVKFKKQRDGMEFKDLCVNVETTKVVVSGVVS